MNMKPNKLSSEAISFFGGSNLGLKTPGYVSKPLGEKPTGTNNTSIQLPAVL